MMRSFNSLKSGTFLLPGLFGSNKTTSIFIFAINDGVYS
jgi:hypothetical protein